MSPDVEAIGRWIMVGVGASAVIGAVAPSLRKPSASLRHVVLLFVFGGLLSGMGTFGLLFVDKYGDFLKVVMSYVEHPSPEKATAMRDQVADQKVPDSYRDLAATALVNHPVDNVDQITTAATSKAGPPEQKAILADVKTRYNVELEARGCGQPPAKPGRFARC